MRRLVRKVAKAILRLFDWMWEPYYLLKDYLRYLRAVELADAAHEKDHDRYYVMPTMDGKLMVMDRKNFRQLKQKGYIHKDARMHNAIAECFYFTPKIGEMEPISTQVRKQKYSEYKAWCKAMKIINHYTR